MSYVWYLYFSVGKSIKCRQFREAKIDRRASHHILNEMALKDISSLRVDAKDIVNVPYPLQFKRELVHN